MIKEHYGLSEKQLQQVLKESGLTQDVFLEESSEWFVLENNQLAPGTYKINDDKVLSESLDDVVYKDDRIKVLDESYPVGSIFGMNVYEAVHQPTNRKIHITVGELR